MPCRPALAALPVPFLAFLALLALGPACKDAETVAAEQKQQALQQHIAEGRMALDKGEWSGAAEHFKAAAQISPQDPMPQMLLSSAYRQGGNVPAALLSLKQASTLMKFKDPAIRKEWEALQVYARVQKAEVAAGEKRSELKMAAEGYRAVAQKYPNTRAGKKATEDAQRMEKDKEKK